MGVGKNIAVGGGIVAFIVFWLAALAASLAPTGLAVWALGHFAFGWW